MEVSYINQYLTGDTGLASFYIGNLNPTINGRQNNH